MRYDTSDGCSLITSDPEEIEVLLSGVDPSTDYYQEVASLAPRDIYEITREDALWNRIHGRSPRPSTLKLRPNLFSVATAACARTIENSTRASTKQQRHVAEGVLKVVLAKQKEQEDMFINSLQTEFPQVTSDTLAAWSDIDAELGRLKSELDISYSS